MTTVRRARTKGRAVSALLAALVLAAASHPAGGEPDPAPAPATEPLPLEARVRAVLEAHCPDCRAAHGETGALDLDALARDPRLVVPQRPDASRAYQRLLAAETAAQAGAAAPAPSEIEAVRDWIESLPAPDERCRGRPLVSHADAEAGMDRWLATEGIAEAADTRFVTMLHLWNACASPAEMRDARETTGTLLAALARRREPPALETIGDESAVIVVRLSALGVEAADWDRLAAGAPAHGLDAVPADWLAARVLSDAADPASDVRFDGAGQIAVAALAGAWSRDVDLVRAAAERGVAPRALAETLSKVDGDFLHAARRLMHGLLTRTAWDRLSRALDGRSNGPPEKEPVPASEIDVLLWADKAVYRPRDLVSLRVSVSRACHLTLIDVDRDGKATVLFPNELEPDNLIAPGVAVSVPGREAGYRLRFDEAGEETVVAICQRASRRPLGISYDYERQRFALLGDWRTFLRTAPEREKAVRAREAAEAARRRRKGRNEAAAPPRAIDPDGGAVEGRAAIYLAIEPGRP